MELDKILELEARATNEYECTIHSYAIVIESWCFNLVYYALDSPKYFLFQAIGVNENI